MDLKWCNGQISFFYASHTCGHLVKIWPLGDTLWYASYAKVKQCVCKIFALYTMCT